ncbi:MAG TPA: hypothetical protein VFU51_07890 [Gaiellaceae bacterium]|nr:hypothetical protein [Gaiellaceae bacterium]
MGTGIVITLAGVVITLLGVALLTNFRSLGERTAVFGGSLTFMVGGGDALRRPRRVSLVWGVLLMIIGFGWFVGGLYLATK